jgi:hypothetical protein
MFHNASRDPGLNFINNSFNQCRTTMVERAGRSVVDRSLGMGEAAGSIPAQSIHFLYKILSPQRICFIICHQCVDPRAFSCVFILGFFILGYQRDYSGYYAHP